MQRVRSLRAGSLATAFAVVVIGTILLERLFRQSGRQWGAAVQAMVGIVLTVATAAYATLTLRMLRVMERAPLAAANQEAVHRVVSILFINLFRMIHVQERFPVDITGDLPDTALFSEEIESLGLLFDELEPNIPQLPRELKKQGVEATRALLTARRALVWLDSAVLMERDSPVESSGKATWHGAKGRYYADVREDEHEWDDLIAGVPVIAAKESLTGLMGAVLAAT